MARIDRLFRPFTRLHTTQEFERSGIGLTTVRRIVAMSAQKPFEVTFGQRQPD